MTSTTISPYLFFANRCEEALEFYGQALAAQVDFLCDLTKAPNRRLRECCRTASKTK